MIPSGTMNHRRRADFSPGPSSNLLRPANSINGDHNSSSKLTSVIDVYELAQSSAADLERILQTYPVPEHERQSLVLKLQYAFEQLEEQLLRHEDRDKHIDKLELQVRELEQFRSSKKDMDDSLRKELHETENEWQDYTNTLLEQVQRLAEENAKLVRQRAQAALESDGAAAVVESKSGIDTQTQAEALNETISHLQEMMQLRENELRDMSANADEKTQAIQELRETVKRLKRTRKDALRQSKRLFEQNMALQKNVKDVELRNVGLKHEMFELVQCNDELRRQVLAAGTPATEVKEFLPSKTLQHELYGDPKAPSMQSDETDDDDDEEKPRFTLRELKQLLDEKTALKQQVIDLKEETEYFQQKQKSVVKLVSTASQAAEGCENDESELTVQGPMPEEPAEKLLDYAGHQNRLERKSSTVKKLFRSVFGDLAKSPSIATLLGGVTIGSASTATAYYAANSMHRPPATRSSSNASSSQQSISNGGE